MEYTVSTDKKVRFNNKASHCVGTGRMDLALHKEYYDQLKLVQDEIGFSYIRGHGLFSKYMGIYKGKDFLGKPVEEEYCFTYLDMVMDYYRELNIRPILELGFMPDDLASGEEKVFFWEGKVAPPADYDKWAKLVKATLNHLIEKYGVEEVTKFPIEVWNEPNLPTFWKDADMEEYFKLYEVTSKAVKEVNKNFKVGGPAICGVDDEKWLKSFLDFVLEKNLPLDYVSRHHYTSYMPKRSGHYSYIDLHESEDAFRWLERSRDLVDSYDEFNGIEIFVTEFNTSYVPNAPIHDTTLNAAYVAHMLSRLGDKHDSYSYWTFGDVFEEYGIPYTPFHGGFGLVAGGSIKKPTFYTFAFYKKMVGDCLLKEDNAVITKDGDTIRILSWNADVHNEKKDLSLSFDINGIKDGEYFVLESFVDEDHGNPLKVWHEMGEPASLNDAQKSLLKKAAECGLKSGNVFAKDGKVKIDFTLSPNEVRLTEIKLITRCSDKGYDYERTINQKAVSEEEAD